MMSVYKHADLNGLKHVHLIHAGRFNVISILTCIIILLLGLSSCRKLVEADPPLSGVSGSAVYTTDGSAISAVTGIYAQMVNGSSTLATGSGSISLLAGLSADEFVPYSGLAGSDNRNFYYKNALYANSTSTTPGTEMWTPLYKNIYTCNSAIEALSNVTTLTPAVRQQLLGEAKFLRAFFYFYLVNLYGDVPLALTSDYTVTASLPRSSQAQVYQQIIADLTDAQSLLSDSYLDGTLLKTTLERVRPTQWAATAFLARVYLYTTNWAGADVAASKVINHSSLYSLSALTGANGVFMKNSNEAIWQLQPVITGHNTEDAWVFVLPSTGPSSSYPVYMGTQLLNSFEPGDGRRTSWVKSVTVSGTTTYYYPSKYQSATLNAPVTEYNMMLRLGEQYLIRAEARAQEGDTSGAKSDLNSIRTRAGGLSPVTAGTQPALLTAVQHERQVELFTEWGHRWLDLKRTGNVDAVMGSPGEVCAAKGGVWNSNWVLYPIYLGDLQKDLNLSQNAGY